MTAPDLEVSGLRRGLIALALTPAMGPLVASTLAPAEPWNDLVVIDGWVLLRSDLRDISHIARQST
jgi:hypothetical protein